MKRFILFARVYCFWSTILPLTASAQDSTIIYPNYVVIGAFAIQENAVEFNDDAHKNKFSSRFEMNPNRNLYYVYILTTDDRAFAFEEARKLRRDTKYFDTWVYSGPLGENRGQIVFHPGASQDFNPETEAPLQVVTVGQTRTHNGGADDQHPGFTSTPSQQEVNGISPSGQQNNSQRRRKRGDANQTQTQQTDLRGKEDQNIPLPAQRSAIQQTPRQQQAETFAINPGGSQQLAEKEKQANADAGNQSNESISHVARSGNGQQAHSKDGGAHLPDIDTSTLTETGRKAIGETIERLAMLGPPPERATSTPLTKEEVTGKEFYFYLFRGDNLATVDGEVDAIDVEKARRMATYQGNTAVKVVMPSGKLKQISFVCQVFGYRKQQREYDPINPPDDIYLDKKGNLVVPFELARLQKGDIAIMYNVFFFKDAAVMRPESRFEVNNLLEFLVENPSYKIMIHGHTNGNASGKIIRMDTPGNFYSLSGTKQGFGSAKQLSEERANVIREFLVASGISPDRMNIRAWGGKKPIHDKHSVRANENVRVEIEILPH